MVVLAKGCFLMPGFWKWMLLLYSCWKDGDDGFTVPSRILPCNIFQTQGAPHFMVEVAERRG